MTQNAKPENTETDATPPAEATSRDRIGGFESLAGRTSARIERFFIEDRIGRRDYLVLSVIFVALYVLLFGHGAVVVTHFPGDFLFVLGDAWRIASGERAYLDFLSPIGPMFYWLLDINGRLRGTEAIHVASINFFPALFVSLASLWILSRRVGAGLAWSLTLFFVVVALSPRDIDLTFQSLGFFGPYNTLGWAAIAPVIAAGLFSRRIAAQAPLFRPGRDLPEALVVGFLFFFALALKPTIAAPAVLAAAVALVFHRHDRVTVLLAGLFATLLVGLGILAMGAGFEAWLGSVRDAMAASDGARTQVKINELLNQEIQTIVVLIGTVYLLEQYRKDAVAGSARVVSASLAALLIAVAVMFNNHEVTLVGSVFVFALFLAFQIERIELDAVRRRMRFLLGAAPLVLFLSTFVFQDSVAVVNKAARGTLAALSSSERLLLEERGVFIVGEDTDAGFSMPVMAHTVSTVAERLKDEGLGQARVLAGDFSNPYPWLMRAPSPRGTILSWYDGSRTFSRDRHPRAETTFAEVDVVVKHKWSHERYAKPFWDVYGEYIAQNYTLIASDEWFEIWLSNDFPGPRGTP